MICRILGHRWMIFFAEQCPLEYRACERCRMIRHRCNRSGMMANRYMRKPYRCNVCWRLFDNAKQAEEHWRNTHAEEGQEANGG